jgi:hypothetical protein
MVSDQFAKGIPLTHMSPAELDELFRNSPAGPIPRGEAEGTALIAPGSELSEIAAKFIHIFIWKGKVFDPETGLLQNKITPLGIEVATARVYKGESWLDGKECIILDYSQTTLIAQRAHDEIREIAPGQYLGIAFWGKVRLIHFALSFPAS